MTEKKLGIIGCGQLAQMLAIAAKNLQVDVSFLRVDETPLVQGLGKIYESSQLNEFLNHVHYVTVEREDLPESILSEVANRVSLSPGYEALIKLRSRHSQKAVFEEVNIPTAPWKYVVSSSELENCLKEFPDSKIRAKQVLGGYDGGGQWSFNKADGAPDIPEKSFPIIIESEIKIDFEVSALIARSRDGEIKCYPINKNIMKDGILIWSLAPADIPESMASKLRQYASALLKGINYVGVLAMEFFVCGDQILVNEIAPRVHNTGHWTIEGCECDQFEQHVRAVTDMPLRDPAPMGAAALCNILGDYPLPDKLPDYPVRMYLHGYGKHLRPGRKMGHLTLVGNDYEQVFEAATKLGM